MTKITSNKLAKQANSAIRQRLQEGKFSSHKVRREEKENYDVYKSSGRICFVRDSSLSRCKNDNNSSTATKQLGRKCTTDAYKTNAVDVQFTHFQTK